MRLDDFSRSGLVVEVWSDVLGEVVMLAADNACLDPGETRAVYRTHELRVLLDLREPSDLQRIHEVKKTFRGTITDAGPAGRDRRAR